MNTKIFFTFSILISLFFLISCSSEDRFVVCKSSEYDCDYQHSVPGIITITKGSSRKHYILTEKGLEKTGITEGEPVSYNPETGTALVKEVTDSSVDIFAVNAENGKIISPEIPLKPEKTLNEKGKNFYAFPKLLSACVQNDGTIVLLVNYETPAMSVLDDDSAETVFLNVYEKGETKKLKKYRFMLTEEEKEEGPSENNDEESNDYSWNEPKRIQCSGNELYLFSEKHHFSGLSPFHVSQPNWIMSRIDLGSKENETNITDMAFIAHDDITFNHYYRKKNIVGTILRSPEEGTEALRILKLENGYELPEEPVEKKDGGFLFSETPDGKPLIFFVKTRSRLEDQRIELLEL